ncbi:MAG: alpha/beta fold hydrolase [Pseudomonadota bacterium]
MSVTIVDRKITCQDQRELAATVFRPTGPLRGAILIGGATGIRRVFYRHFSQALCENGYGILTFDFRGVGDSSLQNPKKDRADIIQWGERDLNDAFGELMKEFPSTKYHLIGHSAGSQLTGLMKNHPHLQSQVSVAGSTGNINNMKAPFWWSAQFFMRVFIPLSNLLFGYSKLDLVNMGQPIPKRVGQQWCEWCLSTGYIRAGLGHEIKSHFYDKVSIPILWLNATDDPIANNENVQEMIELHPNAKSETKTLDPKEIGIKEIGHMKFFSQKNKSLWPVVFEWIEKHQ